MLRSRLVLRSLLPLPLVAGLLVSGAPEPSRERWSGPADLLILTRGDTGRPGFATLLALYPVLGDGDVHDFYLDADGDGREDATFRFRAGEEDFRVEMLFGPTGSGQASSLLTRAEDGARAFAYQTVANAEIPGCGTGRLYVGAGRMQLQGAGTLVALELPENCLSSPGLRPKVSAARLVSGGRETAIRVPARPVRRLHAIDSEFPHLAPGLAHKVSCCSGPNYICFYYAQVRAGFTPPSTCSTAISGTGFGTIPLSSMPQAQIVDWGSHAGYIKLSTSSTITTDEFNRSGSCAVSSHSYSSSTWGDGVTGAAVRAWVLRPAVPGLSSPANGATGVGPTVTLTWGSVGASAYTVDYKTSASSTWTSQQVSSPSLTLSLAASTTYNWRVQSLRGPYGGQYVTSNGTSSTWSFTTAAPCSSITVPWIVPANFQGHPQITWTAASGADKYKIYRSTGSPPGTFVQVGETTGTSWYDPNEDVWTGPPPPKVYKNYKIKAVNDGPGCNPAYETGFSNYLQFTCEGLLD